MGVGFRRALDIPPSAASVFGIVPEGSSCPAGGLSRYNVALEPGIEKVVLLFTLIRCPDEHSVSTPSASRQRFALTISDAPRRLGEPGLSRARPEHRFQSRGVSGRPCSGPVRKGCVSDSRGKRVFRGSVDRLDIHIYPLLCVLHFAYMPCSSAPASN
jgi:hypothetical protein